jgi:hypothetical protein
MADFLKKCGANSGTSKEWLGKIANDELAQASDYWVRSHVFLATPLYRMLVYQGSGGNRNLFCCSLAIHCTLIVSMLFVPGTGKEKRW